jgi:Alpha-L-arabinofuranosidase B, catalytic
VAGRSRAGRLIRRFRQAPRITVAVIGAFVVAALCLVAVTAAPAHAQSTPEPCDIYSSYGTPCVAAYSMDRALYSAYDGPLYQVQRASDDATASIGLLSAGGDVNASEQDSFCAGTTCKITEIYDQSPEGNNLTIEGPGGNGGQDSGAIANALPITIGGNEAYGLDIEQGTGYRDDTTQGVATGAAPEGMYMLASGTHVNSLCCFDFGNAETDNTDNGAGTMDAVNLTTYCGNNSQPCTGSGPWVEADLENGQWMGDGSNPADTGNGSSYVTAMLKNNGTDFELEGGNGQSGGLTTYWDGPLPSGYTMNKEGAVVLGTGGDNSNSDVGSWFEGVMTQGFPSDAADAAVQANIVAAGYAGDTSPSGSTGAIPNLSASAAGQAVVHSAGATGAGAYGFSSVYTVDSSTGDLQETYLPYMGDAWTTQNLSALYGTPPVMAGTQPVALVHCGFTSVYTVDAGSGDLQETYLSAIGQPWATQNLSANYGTPPTDVTPTAVEHYAGATGATQGCGFTSVYTVDASNDDLQETYLPNAGFPGDPWTTQNLSALFGTPPVLAGTSPVSIVHCGYTSVYTVDAGTGDLQETYLPYITDSWSTQNLSVNYGTPPTDVTPTAVVHTAGAPGATEDCGYTSVYTVDHSNTDLQETYLSNVGFPGDPWATQDLSAKYGTPQVLAGTSPVALVHMNYTSVYTVDEDDQLQETYLPEIGDGWSTQSLSANYGTPLTTQTPIVLLHPDASGNLDWTSVYTVDQGSGDLQETYLSNVGFPGDPWATQDLSAKYGTPPST